LGSEFLHKLVREQGGAYGAGASLGMNGVFNIHSYRDPQTLGTYENYRKAIKEIADGNFE